MPDGSGGSAEVERLIVRLMGDGGDYDKVLKQAVANTNSAVSSIMSATSKMADEQAAMLREAAKITQAVSTPLELYQQRLDALKGHLDGGRVSQETYSRAITVLTNALPHVAAQQAAVNSQLSRAAAVTAANATTTENYALVVRELNQLKRDGLISEETYNRALTREMSKLPYYVALEEQARKEQERLNQAKRDGARITAANMTPHEQYYTTMRQLNDALREGTISLDTHSRAHNAAYARLPEVNAARQRELELQRQADQVIQGSLTRGQQQRQAMDQLNRLYQGGFLTLGQYTQAHRQVNRELSLSPLVARAARDELQRLHLTLQRFGRMWSMYITTPIAGFAAYSVHAFASFDDAMTKSLAIMTNVTARTRRMMESKAVQISSNSITAPTDLAKAYYELASAGLTAQQSLDSIGIVEKFAVAGAFDMAKATELAIGAQTALGMRSKESAVNIANLTRVTDVLTAANNLAMGTTQQYSEALTNKAAAALRLLNKDIEEGVSILMVYGNQNIKGVEAGEKMAIMLRELQKAVLKHGDEWKRLGLSVFDADGQMRKTADIVEQFETLFAGMSPEVRNATFQMLGFDARSRAAFQALLGFSGQMREFEAELRNAGGTVEEVANKQLQSFTAQMKIAWNQITIMAIDIGRLLAPGLAYLADMLKGVTRWWGTLSDAGKRGFLVFMSIIAAIGPLTIGLGALVGVVAMVAGGIAFFLTVGWEIVTVAAAIVGGVAVVAAGMVALGAAIAGATYYMVGPEGMAAAWDVLKEGATNFIQDVIGFFANFSYNWKELTKFVGGNWAGMLVDMADMWITFQNNLIYNLTMGLVPGLIFGFRGALDGFKSVINKEDLPHFLYDYGKAAADAFGDGVEASGKGMNVIEADTEGATEAVVGLAREILDLNEKVTEQIATFGQLHDELEVYKLRLKGATDEQLRGVLSQIEYLKYLKEQKKETEKAAELMKKYISPQEKFRKTQDELISMFNKGLISLSAFNYEMKEAQRQMNKELHLRFRVSGLEGVRKGTVEAMEHLEMFREAARLNKPIVVSKNPLAAGIRGLMGNDGGFAMEHAPGFPGMVEERKTPSIPRGAVLGTPEQQERVADLNTAVETTPKRWVFGPPDAPKEQGPVEAAKSTLETDQWKKFQDDLDAFGAELKAAQGRLVPKEEQKTQPPVPAGMTAEQWQKHNDALERIASNTDPDNPKKKSERTLHIKGANIHD
jgi:TP901 family phage tail tape measure protein